jgi:RNA polymerase sigma-70 factor (ECF subfamily)
VRHLSDENLVERVRSGESPAFEELYRRYERRLFAFIRQYLPSRAGAEDVFHEAFLAVLKDRQASFEQGSFRAWIYRVARNLCLNRIRSDERERKAKALYLVTAPTAAEPAEALRASGLSYEEMAQSLGIPLGTVKSRMHLMVQHLRKEFGE